MIARTVFVASVLTFVLIALAARADPGSTSRDDAERPACRIVKVVYAGHGEAERAPCRPKA